MYACGFAGKDKSGHIERKDVKMLQRLFFAIISFTLLFSFTACNANNEVRENQENHRMDQSINQDDQNQTRYGYENRNPNPNQEDQYLNRGQNEIGYFRYNPVHYQNTPQTAQYSFDRPILAKQIASLVAVLSNVKESTVLVTDDHVFVGIITKNGKRDAKTVKEARRTAESLTPRYFQVHVTDSKKLESTINQLGLRMQGDGDIEGNADSLNDLLRRMGDDTPPG